MTPRQSWTQALPPIDFSPELLSRVIAEQGALILSLVETWADWVHRRVERVTLVDPVTSHRRVSVDFTLAHEPDIPRVDASQDGDGAEAYLVPVTMLAKHRMTNLSLSDETGRAIPIWTQRECALVATAMLVEAALDVRDATRRDPVKMPVPPEDILSDFWLIAYSEPKSAIERWQKLGDTTAIFLLGGRCSLVASESGELPTLSCAKWDGTVWALAVCSALCGMTVLVLLVAYRNFRNSRWPPELRAARSVNRST